MALRRLGSAAPGRMARGRLGSAAPGRMARGRLGSAALRLLAPAQVAPGLHLCVATLLCGCTSISGSLDWYDVQRRDLPLTVDVRGSLEAVESDSFGPPSIPSMWDFKIRFMATEGVAVEAGDRILAFDTSTLDQRLKEYQNDFDTSDKQLETKLSEMRLQKQQTKLELARLDAAVRKAQLKSDRPREITGVLELRLAELDLQKARSEREHRDKRNRFADRLDQADLAILRDQRDRARARVEELQTYIQKMVVTAPQAGTVIHKADWRGDKPKIGDSVWRGRGILELVSLRELYASGHVDEVDIARISVKQSAKLRLEAHPDHEIPALLTEIQQVIERESDKNELRVARVKLSMETPEQLRIRPGMRFRGSIEIGRRARVLTIPIKCIFFDQKGPVVYRQTSTGFERVGVQVGARNATDIEIESGLALGDRVSGVDLAEAIP